MPRQDHRALGLGDHLGSFLERRLGGVCRRAVAGQAQVFRVGELCLFDLGVLADIDQHRAGAPAAGDVERLPHHLGDLIRPGDQVVVLGDGQGDAGHVRLLEGIPADQVGVHLPGDAHNRG